MLSAIHIQRDKCRDNYHLTGAYRGSPHQRCNLSYFNNRYLPVVMQSLRGYDSHMIIKNAFEITQQTGNRKIKAEPNSKNKFMAFSVSKGINIFQSLLMHNDAFSGIYIFSVPGDIAGGTITTTTGSSLSTSGNMRSEWNCIRQAWSILNYRMHWHKSSTITMF